jgi:P22 coat protein - gene protein 5
MSLNNFVKQQYVNFSKTVEEWDSWLTMAGLVGKIDFQPQLAQRSSDTQWFLIEQILADYDGLDQTGNFQDIVQLSVPCRISEIKAVPWQLNATQRRDPTYESKNVKASVQQLGRAVNALIRDVISNQSTVVVTRPNQAQDYDDIAAVDEALNRMGIPVNDRRMVLSNKAYNGLASDLAGRQTMLEGINVPAYRRNYVGRDVAGFDLFKQDVSLTLTAADTPVVTINGAGQNYTPAATTTSGNGDPVPQDNRYQELDVTIASGTVKIGDCFTIEDVNEVHHLDRQTSSVQKIDTGEPKTFRVINILSGGGDPGDNTLYISPPITSNDGTTDAQIQWQNVIPATAPFAPTAGTFPADGASLTFLNTVDSQVSTFWYIDAVKIIPGTLEFMAGEGLKVLMDTTPKSGLNVYLTIQTDGTTGITSIIARTSFGVTMFSPEQAGILLFGQT